MENEFIFREQINILFVLLKVLMPLKADMVF